MIRRALFIAIATVALVAVPAAAQEYDGTSATAGATADGDIAVSAEGFNPNATVNYQVDFEPFGDENALGVVGGYEGEIALGLPVALPLEIVEEGTTQADAAGNVAFEVEGRGEGRYEITMTDGENTAVASAVVGDAALPNTGSDSSIPFAQIGVVLLMLGAVAVYAAKRRRTKNTFA